MVMPGVMCPACGSSGIPGDAGVDAAFRDFALVRAGWSGSADGLARGFAAGFAFGVACIVMPGMSCIE